MCSNRLSLSLTLSLSLLLLLLLRLRRFLLDVLRLWWCLRRLSGGCCCCFMICPLGHLLLYDGRLERVCPFSVTVPFEKLESLLVGGQRFGLELSLLL